MEFHIMNPPQKALKNEHEVVNMKLGDIIEDLKDGKLDLDLLDEVEGSLKNHIYIEEISIFPKILKNSNLHLEISGMETEHAALWRLFMLIRNQMAKKDYSRIPKHFEDIRLILLEHNRREEILIYPLVEDDMIKDLTRPEDWVCNKIRKYPNQK